MKFVLFDLDGTISDSREGIIKSFQYALKELGEKVLTENDLLKFIGPPLMDTMQNSLNLPYEVASKGKDLFRDRYGKVGKYENKLYDGINEVIYTLTQHKILLGIATSKPERYAKDILEHFGIIGFFPIIVGASMDDSFSKKIEIMKKAIEHGKLRNPEINEIYMVGDRCYDMESSKKLGVTAIGVAYGFGSVEELKESGADYICDKPQDILPIILK